MFEGMILVGAVAAFRSIDVVRGPECARSVFAPDLWGGYLIEGVALVFKKAVL